ncbi:MAG: hypothetical protein Q8908_13160 [Bacteroidota bacterium]|nr:hypothetical protein [Bacteroidota bacterium]
MKKIQLLIMVLLLVAVYSCKKESTNQPATSQYVKYIPASFNIQSSQLKAAPPATAFYDMIVYKGTKPNFSYVDGSEFFPGSTPQIEWAAWAKYPHYFGSPFVAITYCPIMPLRTVTEIFNNEKNVAYLAINDFTPDKSLFPLAITCKRLGDVLIVNKDAIASIPGYHFDVKVDYELSTIDVENTGKNSWATPGDTWPQYLYSGTTQNSKTLLASDNGANGDVSIYDDVQAKITGITLTITDANSNTTIVKPVDPSAIGKGLKLVLKSTNTGWYDSGNPNITSEDITVVPEDVNIDK